MNIAIFSSTIEVTNGYGNITFELCKNLQAKGVSFTLFLPRSEREKYVPPGVPVRYELPSYIFRPYTPKVFPYLFSDIDLSNFTMVHSLFEFPYAFMAARLSRKYRLPFVMGVQGTYGVLPLTRFPDRLMLQYAYMTAREILAASEFTRSSVERYSKRALPISIVHNGVDFERFNRPLDLADLRKRYEGCPLLITVGGVKWRKGQDIVIRALPRILQVFPKTKYLIVGEGANKEMLATLSKEQGVEANVEFVGSKSRNEVVKYFQACDIYVHTPRITGNLEFEGFGIVYLEASACGKPIVATDAGGIRDAVLEGKTGFIAPDEDSGKVAEYCIWLLGDKARRDQMGSEGKEYAQRHSWPLITEQFIRCYKIHSGSDL